SFDPRRDFPVDVFPSSVVVADLNGDGWLDLVCANAGTNAQPGHTLSVLLGNGDGAFGPSRNFAVGPRPISVAVADVNGDGRPDLVSANYSGNTLSVLLG